MSLRNPSNTKLFSSKIMGLYRRIKTRIFDVEQGNYQSAVTNVSLILKKFFTRLRKPMFIFRPLIKGDFVNADIYNESIEDIKDDLDMVHEEAIQTTRFSAEIFNIGQIQSEELSRRAAEAASKVTDLRILSGQLDGQSIVAGDDFQDTSKVDTQYATQFPKAEVIGKDGVCTLARLDSENILLDGAEIEITPVGLTVGSNADNTERFYEGDFYDFVGKARPEGGGWHIEELVDPSLLDDLTGDRTGTAGDVNQNDSNVYLGGEETHLYLSTAWMAGGPNWVPYALRDGAINDLRTPGGERQVGDPLRPEDVTVIDRGATKEEKRQNRNKMIDGNSDSFWECEYVLDAAELASDNVVFDDAGNVSTSLSQQQLRNRASLLDQALDIDLEIYITIKLPETRDVNWLSINPMNFGENTYLQVIEVSTALDEGAGFIPVEGLDSNRFANVLSASVNEELQEEDVAATMAPSRNSFRGQGVFSFPSRSAKMIRFKLRQTTPVPNPYQRMVIELNRTRVYDFGYTASRNSHNNRISRFMKRVVYLSYLQTVQVLTGLATAADTVGTTTPAAPLATSAAHATGGWALASGTTRAWSFALNDSGWQMGRSWLETFYDKIRYAIGIREIGAFSYRYSNSSELVSKEFMIPQGIWKMQLQVDEDVPADFDSAKRYVQYYVSIDNGGSWTEINPIDHPTIYDSGIPVPKTLTVAENIAGPTSDEEGVLSLKDATSVRVKAILSNEPTLANPDNYSPSIRSYRLKIFPKAGN